MGGKLVLAASLMMLAAGCSTTDDDDDAAGAATTNVETTEATTTTLAPTTTTAATTTTLAPTTTTAATTTTLAPATTTAATTTTLAPATTVDPVEADAALIRRLVYEQQQFMQNDFGPRGDWTADDLIEYLEYLHDRTEPSAREAAEMTCSNWRELQRDWWSSVANSDEPAMFDRWSVDLDTLQPDPDWVFSLSGVETSPAGNTYIATVTFQDLFGETLVADVHFNVQGGEAFWFWAHSGDGCVSA